MAALTVDNVVEPMTNALSAAISNNTTSRIPGLKNLSLSGTRFDQTTQVEEYLALLEEEFLTNNITDVNKKKNALVHHMGKENWMKVKQLPESTDNALNAYEKTKKRLKQTFCMANAKSAARGAFDTFASERNETFLDGYIRLKRICLLCEFGESESERILDKLRVCYVHDPTSLRIKHKTRDETDLAKVLQTARDIISEKDENDLLRKEHPTQNQVNSVSKYDYSRCKFCGQAHNRGKCPALGAQCHSCHGLNHYQSCCPKNRNRGGGRFQSRGRYNHRSNNYNHNYNKFNNSASAPPRGSSSRGRYRSKSGRRGGRRTSYRGYRSNNTHVNSVEASEVTDGDNPQPDDSFENETSGLISKISLF